MRRLPFWGVHCAACAARRARAPLLWTGRPSVRSSNSCFSSAGATQQSERAAMRAAAILPAGNVRHLRVGRGPSEPCQRSVEGGCPHSAPGAVLPLCFELFESCDTPSIAIPRVDVRNFACIRFKCAMAERYRRPCSSSDRGPIRGRPSQECSRCCAFQHCAPCNVPAGRN